MSALTALLPRCNDDGGGDENEEDTEESHDEDDEDGNASTATESDGVVAILIDSFASLFNRREQTRAASAFASTGSTDGDDDGIFSTSSVGVKACMVNSGLEMIGFI